MSENLVKLDIPFFALISNEPAQRFKRLRVWCFGRVAADKTNAILPVFPKFLVTPAGGVPPQCAPITSAGLHS